MLKRTLEEYVLISVLADDTCDITIDLEALLEQKFNESRTNQIIAACDITKIFLTDIVTDKVLKELEGHTLRITSVAFINPKELITTSLDKTIRIWDTISGRCILNFPSQSCSFSATIVDKNTVATCGNGIRFWNVNTGQCLRTLDTQGSTILVLKLHGNSLISAGRDSRIRFWDLTTFECTQNIEKVALCSTYDLIVTSSYVLYNSTYDVFKYSLKNESTIEEVMYESEAGTIEFIDENTYAWIDGSQKHIYLLNIANGRIVAQMERHASCIKPLGNDQLVIGTKQGFIRVLDRNGGIIKSIKVGACIQLLAVNE
jgi:WD40 repeat protein